MVVKPCDELTEKQQAVIESVLSADGQAAWDTAFKKFTQSLNADDFNQQNLADCLVEQLGYEHSPRRRGRLITLLAEVNAPNTADLITQYADPEQESSDRIQSRALIALYKVAPPDLEKRLSNILKSKKANSRVRASALRLLIHHSVEDRDKQDEYATHMLEMAKDGNSDNSWAVLKALRKEDYPEYLPQELEKRFAREIVEPVLKNSSEWRDIRLQAIRVLGDSKYEWQNAIYALSTAYQLDPSDTVRLYCIKSLGKLGIRLKRREIQDVMLLALEDQNADIRNRAVESLEMVLKQKTAVQTIIDNLLQKEIVPDGYIDALRQISSDDATRILSDSLWHPDPEVGQRASQALTKLGGERAMQTLLSQRQQAVDKYTELLEKADEKAMAQHEGLMSQARLSFRISLGMHLTVFIIGLVILMMGAITMLTQNGADAFVGLAGASGGFFAVMMAMFYRNPVRNIERTTTMLIKINITFLGYMRQINQVDATFKHLYLNTSGFSVEQMKETVEQIQIVVNRSLERVQTYIVDNEVVEGE